MKRIISSFVLIALCIAVCITSSVAVETKAEGLKNSLDILEKEITAENYTQASVYIVKLEEEWEKAEKIFSSLSETKLIDELDLSFNSLEKYIQSGQPEQALIIIEECRNGLETICQWQKITIDNIL